MDMEKKIIIIIIIIVLILIKFGIAQEHIPIYNKILFKLYPHIAANIKFPQVPRISAQEAFRYYTSGNAFFLGGGHYNSAVPGGLYFEDLFKVDIERIKETFFPDNKLLIVYCH